MDRPSAYQDSYVVNRNFPYERVEQLPSGEYLGGGVLGKGQRVWMRHEAEGSTYHNAVSVYVEEIDIISLNPSCLSRFQWQKPTNFTGNADQGLSVNEIVPA